MAGLFTKTHGSDSNDVKRAGRRVHMKKLAVLLMIPALAMFMVPTLATADGHGHGHGIHGTYAVTGYTTCGAGEAGIFEGDYTFNHDGTGSAQGFVRNITQQGPGFLTFTVDFTYEVTQQGKIAFAYPSYGFKLVITDEAGTDVWGMTWDRGPSHGVISPDGRTLTITCGPPVQLTVVESHGENAPPPYIAKAFCVTTAVGVRLR
jgi:hypothetical protein